MLWQESTEQESFTVADTVQDLSFRFHCTKGPNEVPVDHALMLHQAIAGVLPWLESEPVAAIHNIYGAASGNGWTRPAAEEGGMMQISKRTRLSLRLPKDKLNVARILENTILMLGDREMHIGKANVKPLVAARTLFSRSVTNQNVAEEQLFTEEVAAALRDSHIDVTKLLCGKVHSLESAEGPLLCRSVMLADLSLDHSVHLQQQGYGIHMLLGCGIFLPHKSIGAVGSSQDDA